MTSKGRSVRSARTASVSTNNEEQLEALCARPSCRTPFTRGTGAGRGKIYCGDDCRHAARTELRRLHRRLQHWQGNVAQARADLAVYRGDENADVGNDDNAQRVAAVGLARAAAVLDYIESGDERLLGEFRALYEAVAPLVARAEDVPSVA